MKLIYIILILGALSFMSCNSNTRVDEKWKNYAPIEKTTYVKDSSHIIAILREELKDHRNFFYSKNFSHSTQIIVDTIIYSPDFQKMAIFIYTKDPNFQQDLTNDGPEWYFNATCYLGEREKDSLLLSMGGPSFTNSTDKTELLKISSAEYFRTYAKSKDGNGQYRYKYNIGDVRFWSCPIWAEKKDNRKKQEEFETYRKEHPENVYDPDNLTLKVIR